MIGFFFLIHYRKSGNSLMKIRVPRSTGNICCWNGITLFPISKVSNYGYRLHCFLAPDF